MTFWCCQNNAIASRPSCRTVFLFRQFWNGFFSIFSFLFFKTKIVLESGLICQNAEAYSWSPGISMFYRTATSISVPRWDQSFLPAVKPQDLQNTRGGGEEGSEEKTHFTKTPFWLKCSEQQCWDVHGRGRHLRNSQELLGYKSDPSLFRYSEMDFNQPVGFKRWLRVSF